MFVGAPTSNSRSIRIDIKFKELFSKPKNYKNLMMENYWKACKRLDPQFIRNF